jgi:acetyl esterase/lipase
MLRALTPFLFFLAPLSWTAEFPTERNIRYSPYPETVLDVMQPRDPALKDRPGVIVIHGGGWVYGDKESMVDTYCVPFLEHGFVVANVEYRLAKIATAPAAITDVLNAAKWFSDHASQYKVDPKKIVVMGNSAGGHLALMAGMAPADTDLGPVTKLAAVVNFFGITDVGDQLGGAHRQDYAVAWVPEQNGRLDIARHVSPMTYVRKDVPPILTLHGDADPVVPYEHAVMLTNALKKVGAKAELITVGGGGHGFSPAQMNELWPQIFKFLKKQKMLTNL